MKLWPPSTTPKAKRTKCATLLLFLTRNQTRRRPSDKTTGETVAGTRLRPLVESGIQSFTEPARNDKHPARTTNQQAQEHTQWRRRQEAPLEPYPSFRLVIARAMRLSPEHPLHISLPQLRGLRRRSRRKPVPQDLRDLYSLPNTSLQNERSAGIAGAPGNACSRNCNPSSMLERYGSLDAQREADIHSRRLPLHPNVVFGDEAQSKFSNTAFTQHMASGEHPTRDCAGGESRR
ncbi:hypothetical protein BKA93DRAFT_830267 [Sparassis latifolia]